MECRSILYDNTKIAVAKILGDGKRQRTKAFSELQSHYLFEDKFGRPAKGNDKGNASGFSSEELGQFKSQYDAAIEFYGKDFGKPYGWAATFLRTGNQTFFDLEEAVGLDHWRPYYKWASQNIHANVKAIRNSLGLSEAVRDMLQVGPSNSRMTDPAHSTSISLLQLTCTLLFSAPNLDGIVLTKILLLLSDEVGGAFVKCDEKTSI